MVDQVLNHPAEAALPQYVARGCRSIRESAEADVPGSRRSSLSLSAVVLTKNGGRSLRNCLRSIVESHFADELVVYIDTETTDDSYAVAIPFTTRIHYVQTKGSLELALPHLVSLCSGDYVLRVDDDEYIPGAMGQRNCGVVRLNDVSHFLLATRWLIPPGDMFIADEPWFPDLHVRLFRRDRRLIIYPDMSTSRCSCEGEE